MWHVRGWLISRVGRCVDWWLRKHFGVTSTELHGCRCNRHL